MSRYMLVNDRLKHLIFRNGGSRCYYHKEEKGPLPPEKLEMLCNTSCVQDPITEQKALNIKGTVNSMEASGSFISVRCQLMYGHITCYVGMLV
jgi:hypothetical protein